VYNSIAFVRGCDEWWHGVFLRDGSLLPSTFLKEKPYTNKVNESARRKSWNKRITTKLCEALMNWKNGHYCWRYRMEWRMFCLHWNYECILWYSLIGFRVKTRYCIPALIFWSTNVRNPKHFPNSLNKVRSSSPQLSLKKCFFLKNRLRIARRSKHLFFSWKQGSIQQKEKWQSRTSWRRWTDWLQLDIYRERQRWGWWWSCLGKDVQMGRWSVAEKSCFQSSSEKLIWWRM